MRDKALALSYLISKANRRINIGTSLVAQKLTIRLSMQGTRIQALIPEVPTCHGATRPARHNH